MRCSVQQRREKYDENRAHGERDANCGLKYMPPTPLLYRGIVARVRFHAPAPGPRRNAYATIVGRPARFLQAAVASWTDVGDLLADLSARYVAQRVVRQGKLVTAAGVSAGIDMAPARHRLAREGQRGDHRARERAAAAAQAADAVIVGPTMLDR